MSDTDFSITNVRPALRNGAVTPPDRTDKADDSIVRVPGGAQPDNAPRGTPRSNEVTLIIDGKIWRGWAAVRIGRGIERFPSDFELALTERYPGEAGVLFAEPGQAVVLKIGQDVVVTGWIDRYTPAITPTGHEVRIHGRSRCSDLADCSAGILPDGTPRTQVASSSILSIVQQMADPFGIKVTPLADAAQKIAPQFNVNLGETAAEIIDRVTRWGGLLYYDLPSGDMVLAQVGTTKAASGFQQGVNVEAAGVTLSADQRFSDYYVYLMSTDAFFEVRAGLPEATNGNLKVKLHDDSLPALRYRPHIIISEQVNQDDTFATQRGTWERNRRNGRSRAVTITTDTWRDSAGTLWTPNTLVMVDLPLLKITGEVLVIGETTFRRDESGTHCDLTLMPPGAYQPEPFNLQPINRQVAGDLKGGAHKDTPNTPQYGAS